MMKKTLLLLALSATLTARSQPPKMAEIFSAMPDSLLPLLSPNNRRDMLDFLSNGMEARVRNRMNEESTLRVIGDTYLLLEPSGSSRMELKLLETTDSVGIVALVRTVMGPSADSQVEFYDTEWRRLRWLTFPQPEISEFFGHAPDSLAADAEFAKRSLADLRLVEIKPHADEPAFELVLSVSELERKEKDAASLLVRPLEYLWDGEAFRKRE